MTQIFDALLSSGVLIPAMWISLGFVIVWFLLSAKRTVPLTPEEAETLWKFHKQKSQCQAKKRKEIFRGNKVVGFECECGHEHIQTKHLININA